MILYKIGEDKKMNYAIVLAAGKGSRMKNNIPKCAIPIMDKPMINHIVEQIKNTSIDEIICVVGYKKEYIYTLLKDSVTYKVQETQEGSGHAVSCCKGIDESGYTVILNGDMPMVDYILLQDFINHHLENRNDLTIASLFLSNPKGYGRIIRDKENKITEIKEELELNENEKLIHEVNGGLYCIKTKLLFETLAKIKNENHKKEYYLTDIVKELNGYKISSYFVEDIDKIMGANTLYELSLLEEKMRMRIIKKHLENGVKIEGIQSTRIGKDVIIEENVVLRNCILMGNTIIHKGCTIKDSEIQDSIIFDENEIKYSVIHHSIVGKKCQIGPFSHIRNNSMISGENRIGNFVEIKNSKIGIKSKLSHLAYMGDTLCGNNVNFGCGSITVNFDGKNKNKTNIGDNVFVGCNSNLIAPIDIASNSFIAAGSTITSDLEPGDFAIARSRQVTKNGYASKYE